MGKADGLSRRPDWQKGVEKDNENQMLIKPEWIKRTEILVEEDDLRGRIKRAQEGNKKVVKAVEKLKKTGIKSLKDKEWTTEEGVVIKERHIYIPERGLRGEVIQLYHDIMLLANLQWKVAFDTPYTNKFLIRIHSRTHYQSLECTKVLYEIVSR